MSSTAVAADLLTAQLPTLLATKCKLSGRSIIWEGNAVLEARAAALNATDVRAALQRVQQWLLRFLDPSRLNQTCLDLIELAKVFGTDSATSLASTTASPTSRRSSKLVPHTNATRITVDQHADDSIDFYLLDTLAKLLERCLSLPPQAGGGPAGAVAALDPVVLQFCVRRLDFSSYSAAARHAAARALHFLSIADLDAVCSLFVRRGAEAKKDSAQREFASMQQAVGGLAFGLGSSRHRDATLNYLESLLQLAKKWSRGVLRSEVCESLKRIFTTILVTQEDEVEAFFRREERVDEFFTIYAGFYDLAAKWAKKKKHMVFSYDLMAHMLAVGGERFYIDQERADIFALLTDAAKKSEFFEDALRIWTRLLDDLPSDVILRDMERFTNALRQLIASPAVLGKPKNLEADHQLLITKLLRAIGSKHSQFFLRDVVGVLFRTMRDEGLLPAGGAPSSSSSSKATYSISQRTAVLSALAAVGETHAREVSELNYMLGNPIAYIIDHEEDAGVLSAALRCFPAVRSPDPVTVADTAHRVGTLCASASTSHVANTAAQALERFVRMEPHTNLVPAVYYYVDVLRNLNDLPQESLLQACQKIHSIFDSAHKAMAAAQAKVRDGEEPLAIDADAWRTLRQHIESAALAWLCHPESWVRTEMLRLLDRFSIGSPFRSPTLCEGADDPPDSHFLCDVLLDPSQPAMDLSMEMFWPGLEPFLRNHLSRFMGVVASTWSLLYERVFAILPLDLNQLDEHHEWYMLWSNQVQFLSMAMRPQPSLKDFDGQPVDRYATMVAQLKQAEPDAQSFHKLACRPSLDNFCMSELQNEHFLAGAMACMHMYVPGADEMARVVGRHVSASLARAHRVNQESVASKVMFEYEDIQQSRDTLVSALNACGFDRTTTAQAVQHVFTNPPPPSAGDRPPPPPQPTTPKKRASIVNTSPSQRVIYHEHTINWVALVLGTLNDQQYHYGSALLRNLHELLVKAWMRTGSAGTTVESRMFEYLPAGGKLNVVRVLERFLHFVQSPLLKKPALLEAAMENREVYFSFMQEHILDAAGDPNATDVFERLHVAVIEVVQAMLELGPIMDIRLEDHLLEVLQMLPGRGAHTHDSVTRALTLFLHKNPHRLDDFLCRTLPETHAAAAKSKSQEQQAQQAQQAANAAAMARSASRRMVRINSIILSADMRTLVHRDAGGEDAASSAIAIFYMRACVRNFVDEMEHWTDALAFAPVAMAAFSLLHQFSHDMEARLLALELARAISRHSSGALHPGYDVVQFTHQSPFMYSEAAVKYSEALAAHEGSHELAPAFLHQLVRLAGWASSNNKEMLLRAAIPWTRHFGKLVGAAASVVAAAGDDAPFSAARLPPSQQLLFNMFQLTKLCHGKSVHMQLLQMMWVSIFDEEATVEVSCPQVCEFFIRTLDEDEALLKMVFVDLSRSSAAGHIAEYLVGELRTELDTVPADPHEFLKFKKQQVREPEPPSRYEHAAFSLIPNLLFEFGDLFTVHLPLLLQNALAVFSSEPAGQEMATFVFLHLGIYDPDVEKFTDEYLVAELQRHYPKLHQAWARLTFVWATNVRDDALATRSFELFKQLNTRAVGSFVLQRLALSMFTALRSNNDDTYGQIREILDIFMLPLADGAKTSRERWQLLVSLGFALLAYGRASRFRLGLALLNHVLVEERHAATAEEKVRWLGEMTIFKSGGAAPAAPIPGTPSVTTRRLDDSPEDDAEQAIDEGISSQMRKGLITPNTSEDTHDMLMELTSAFGPLMVPCNDALLSLLVSLGLQFALAREREIRRAGTDESLLDEERRTAYRKERATYVRRQEAMVDLLHIYGLMELAAAVEALDPMATEESKAADVESENGKTLLAALHEHGGGPTLEVPLRNYFRLVLETFAELDSFTTLVGIMIDFLAWGERQEWVRPLLVMLGHTLVLGRHKLGTVQCSQLSELVASYSFDRQRETPKLCEALAAHLVATCGPAAQFVFVRPAHEGDVPAEEVMLGGITQETEMTLNARVVSDVEKHVFPILERMFDEEADYDGDSGEGFVDEVRRQRQRLRTGGSVELAEPAEEPSLNKVVGALNEEVREMLDAPREEAAEEEEEEEAPADPQGGILDEIASMEEAMERASKE